MTDPVQRWAVKVPVHPQAREEKIKSVETLKMASPGDRRGGRRKKILINPSQEEPGKTEIRHWENWGPS